MKKLTEKILKYKPELSLEENIFQWLSKLHRRGNFSFELGEETYQNMPEEFRACLGAGEQGWHGDYDMLYPFKALSWVGSYGEISPRNVTIEGYMPVHISYNGRPSFGWCWNGSQTPGQCLKFTFFLEEGEDNPYSESITYEELYNLNVFEGEDVILEKKYSRVSLSTETGIKYRKRLNQFLLDLFYICYFREKAGIIAVDRR